jgi:chaperone BCS1
MIPSTGVGLLQQFPPWLLLAGGAAVGWLRNFWNWAYNHSIGMLIRRVTVSVNVEEYEHAEAYIWLQFWVEQRLAERRVSSLLLRRTGKNTRSKFDCSVFEEEDAGNSYELVPAYGVYPFTWRARYLIVFSSSSQEAPASSGGGGNSDRFGPPRRQSTLTIWGTRNRELLLELIAEASEAWDAAHPRSLHYYYHRYSYWRSRPLAERPRSTVYLPNGMLEDILEDAREFLSKEKAFHKLGIPWRHGILFYGPPGGGKTTLVQCIASELHLPLYYLSLSSLASRDDLAELLDSMVPGALLLIEDIDAIGAAAERMSAKPSETTTPNSAAPLAQTTVVATTQSKITASDLLNFIDGIIASQGRLLIMTTNHPEILDRALTRPGRVDKKWEIPYAGIDQLLAFHSAATIAGLTSISSEDFLHRLPSPCTIADAQGIILCPSQVLDFPEKGSE